MDPLTMIGVGSSLAGALGGLFGKKKKQDAAPTLTNTLTPDQQAVSSKLTKILTQGGAAYGKPRIAPLTPQEGDVNNYLANALNIAAPGIERQLSGQFPEEYFNQAIADPTRRQFNERVAPIIRENSELTGNRFADRSAIELGQARGDVESSILAERGKFGLETYRDPLNALSGLTGALQGAEQIFAVPRTIEQAKLDADFQEFLRTNPDSGGLIDAMLNFTSQGQNVATMPAQEQSIFPSLFEAGTSLLGNMSMANALGGGGSTTSNAVTNTKSTLDRVLQRVQRPYYTSLTGALG